MRWIRLFFRVFGWLLTPLLAWAASFFGAVAGAVIALRMGDPIRGVIVTAACGGLAGFLTILAWLRYLRHSPEVRQALAVTEDGTPDTTDLGMLAIFALGTLTFAPSAKAQAIGGSIGQFYDGDGWTGYHATFANHERQPVALQFHGDLYERIHDYDGRLAGLGLDVTAFRSRIGGPYAVIGLGGGLGSETENAYSKPWATWSAGGGYDFYPLSFLSLGVEGRWRGISLGKRNGIELAVGLGVHFGGGGAPRKPSGNEPTPAPVRPLPSEPAPGVAPSPSRVAEPALRADATLADSVIATATAAMGQPYKYGGNGSDSTGFDCSGLIQYAFSAHGITLPRQSADQAKQGKPVAKRVDRLRAGDLLTFSNRGGPVTHVGLYLGGGKFVHSATHGVQVSVLSDDDPYGRWWFKRWVGARRLID